MPQTLQALLPKRFAHPFGLGNVLTGTLFCVLTLFSLEAHAHEPAIQRESLLFKQQVSQAVQWGKANRIGPMPATRKLQLAISLPIRHQDKLNALLKQLYDPSSPRYHHYLTAQEFTKQFGPTQQNYDQVAAWARTNGLAVIRTSPSRQVIDVAGPISAINQALHVRMTIYQHPTEKRTFYAPDREPTLNLTVPVYSISGLDNFSLPHPMLVRGTAQQIKDTPHTGSGPNGDFTPTDIREAYYGNGSLTGNGQTVAVFSYCDYDPNDLQKYYKAAQMPLPKAGTVKKIKVGAVSQCGPLQEGEPILDIGNVIGIASGLSHVLFYEGSFAADILDQMAADNQAKVISSSWVWEEGDSSNVSPAVYQRFAAQGQTFVLASGDGGAYPSGFGRPILNPEILNVGGTTLVTTGPGGTWKSETAWGGSGGGWLSDQAGGLPIPDYQQVSGVITQTNKGSTDWRNGPDVAADADAHNFTVEFGVLTTDMAGTSFAAPRWAAFLALANEAAQNQGLSPVGFINPALYKLGLSSNYQNTFHDITQGNNGGFKAVQGYDLVTGWGSPIVSTLINAFVPPPLAPAISQP